MQVLKEKEKKIIYYRYWEELSYDEIAQRLDMKKTTVYDTEQRILAMVNVKI